VVYNLLKLSAMETRITETSAVFAFLFSFLSFVSLLGNLRTVPLHLTIIGGFLGVVVGAVSAFAVAKRQLNSLGVVVRARLSTILFFIGGLLILSSLTYFFVINTQMATLRILTNFAYPTVSAFAVSETIVFLRWERKNRKRLMSFSNGRSGGLYASPKTDSE
jgi:hypothetical protein